jgi:hypothetical protein
VHLGGLHPLGRPTVPGLDASGEVVDVLPQDTDAQKPRGPDVEDLLD